VRTTVRLDERLLREAKELAHRKGRTFTAVMEDALRQFLARRKEPAPARVFRVRPFKGTGVAPGVDLDDSAALLDLLERAR
jgi:hypothetical protein